MKKLLLSVLCGLALGAQAGDIETDAVLLQALDKTTGRTSFLMTKVGEPYVYGDLTVFVRKCLKSSPEEKPENAVFLDITDNEGKEVFHGWMFSSDPALSVMDHAVYDIWALECKNKVADPAAFVAPNVELDETEEIDLDSLED